jgi:protein-S-isoprenylcysteine O-methyltransferase Ste14
VPGVIHACSARVVDARIPSAKDLIAVRCGQVLFIGMPLALGSYGGLLSFPLALAALVWRFLDEERFLAQNLHGYTEYCAKVRWRLIPGVF